MRYFNLIYKRYDIFNELENKSFYFDRDFFSGKIMDYFVVILYCN